MTITKILKQINRIAGDGSYVIAEVIGYLDEAIDMLNYDLDSKLPLVSEVYEDTFTHLDTELAENYTASSSENDYTRIPDNFIRNFVCYEVVYRKLRDEDESQEVYGIRYQHARTWYQKMLNIYQDATIEDTECIVVGGDVDELLPVTVEETINPYWVPDTDEG